MTKLYFVFNFELTTIFAGYAIFSSMIWINTLVILPKQRVEVKDREPRTDSRPRTTAVMLGNPDFRGNSPFIPVKDNF